MDEQTIPVTLTGRAKIDGVREPAGKTVNVTPTLALQLAASGVINPELAEQLSNALDMSDTALENDFQKAVELAVGQKTAGDTLRIEHLEGKLAEMDEALSTAKSGLENAGSSLQEKERLLDAEKAKVADLETSLTTEQQARTDAEAKLAAAQAELAKLAEQSADKAKPAKTPK
jgi:chromosome segregation ATPase